MNDNRLLYFGLYLIITLNACSKAGVTPQGIEGEATPLFQEGSEPTKSSELPKRTEGSVAPGFQYQLHTLIDSKINGKYRVDFEGYIHLTYDVSIKTTDMNQKALEGAVNAAYQRFFRSEPNITVTLIEKRLYVDVQGLVNKPGKYLVREESSLDEVMSAADGLKTEDDNASSAHYARVKREGQMAFIKLSDYYAGNEGLVPSWQGGETVFFQQEGGTQSVIAQSNAIQILGQVQHPGEYQYVNGATLYYYFAKAGGPNDRADLDKLELIRFEEEIQHSKRFSLDGKGEIPMLQAGDMVIVHAERANAAIANISGVMGSIASAFFIAFGF